MKTAERRYSSMRRMVDRQLDRVVRTVPPGLLYDQLLHVLAGGGKRVRSVLVLLSCEAVGGDVRSALGAAAAVELLHNFTLVHDDIMDNAATRRGRPTVHEYWGIDHGILTGDVLLALANQSILGSPVKDEKRLIGVFTNGFLQVCVGQSEDLIFTGRSNVTVGGYFSMIEKKTAALIATSAVMGGIIGGGTRRQITALDAFGLHLGRAFQVQDDLLDVVADERTLGKKIGGDIEEGKKTFLLVKALERARGQDRRILADVAIRKGGNKRGREFIAKVTEIYRRLGVLDAAGRRIQYETGKAVRALSSLPPGRGRNMLSWMSDMLLKRVS